MRGMTDRIEYLADLGVTCLWLMPFYPTARKDDGYDITDFFGVDPRLGTLGDFVELVRTARSCGIRVIVDFVMNHTSDQHPWFKSARRSVDDPYRDYYVWCRHEAAESSTKDVVFPDQEDSIWERDEKTGEWYLHHFYKHQPDLNVANPECAGGDRHAPSASGSSSACPASGSTPCRSSSPRDTVPGSEPDGFDPQRYLGDVRNFVTRRVGDAVLLGEVNLPYTDQKAFFGGPDGDGLNMQFDFIGMQEIYLSLARGDAGPLAKALRERPALDITSQWANFVRNHDELTLDKLSTAERKEVFAAFGPDPDMQLFGRGLRRRLPTMLGGDERRIRLVYSLMFSLPGTPVLFYGEEIGMGENLDDRGPPLGAHADAVGCRPERRLLHGTEAPARPTRSPTGVWAPEHVNAATSGEDHDSLWSFMRRLIRRYRQMPEIGWSDVEVLDHDQPSVLAHVCRCDDWRLLALHNLGAEDTIVTLELGDVPADAVLRDVLTGTEDVPVDPSGRVEVRIGGHEGLWLRLLAPGEQAYL